VKQVTQRLRDGRIEVLDVPTPELRPEGVLVDVRASLLSAGTERTKVITGRQSLIGKARSRPDQVREVVDKARRDGVRETIHAVQMRLDQPGGLGYSSSGIVIAAGARVRGLRVGDRIACAGADYAWHADVNYVPANLCARLPDAVGFDEGAFTTVGSIALHGVRQADVRVGERVAVIGLGLVGQLAGQILRAAGCFVVGVDLDEQLVARAVENGAVDRGFARSELAGDSPSVEAAGCDAIVITAATRSSDPVALATVLARDRARVVVVGDVGLELNRASWYEKELDLRLSRSYGPGRYDAEYEERGLDYPIGYVRWTERRNMEAFVELIASRKIEVSRLVSESVDIDEATAAYDRLADTTGSTLGILLRYQPVDQPQASGPALQSASETPPVLEASAAPADNVGVIGAGSFAQRVLIPSLREAGFSLVTIASAAGLSASAAGDRFAFDRADTVDNVISDPAVGLVVILTRHASHAELAGRALRAGKHVFVEKPPAITAEQLGQLRDARRDTGRVLAVGFNRRHAPLAQRMREYFAGRGGPIELLYRISAGTLAPSHWLNQLDDGGGRLIGEGCHFIDFACWMVGALPLQVSCIMTAQSSEPLAAAQRFSVTLSFDDGSIASILYGAGGASAVLKEYAEAHAGGRSAVLSDFRRLTLYDGNRASHVRSRRQDKGHRSQAECLREELKKTSSDGGAAQDPLDTMAVAFAALRSAETARSVFLNQLRVT
jgi:predicted dehydrogenase/threonine dehydrogenase-like Zn-dependent dehydrogenase